MDSKDQSKEVGLIGIQGNKQTRISTKVGMAIEVWIVVSVEWQLHCTVTEIRWKSLLSLPYIIEDRPMRRPSVFRIL